MKQLPTLITELTGIDEVELRKLRFKYPQKGLLQSIRQLKGEEFAEELLRKVAAECKIELLEATSLKIHQSILRFSANEIARLAFALKAVPLNIINSTQGEVVQLAMSDPLDSRARTVFQAFFAKPVQVALAREDELLDAVRFSIPTGRRSKRIMRSTENSVGDSEMTSMLRRFIEMGGRELHFEILGGKVHSYLIQSFGREVPFDCTLDPETLIAAALSRGKIIRREPNIFRGVAAFTLLPTGVEFEFDYHADYKSRMGEKGRKLILKNAAVKEEKEICFWTNMSDSGFASLYDKISEFPGLYIAIFPDLKFQANALHALQSLFSDLHVLQNIRELSVDKDTIPRSKYSRIVLPIQSSGVASVLHHLVKAPLALREMVQGLFSYAELSRPCLFCCEELPAPKESLALIPDALHERCPRLSYPRGCPICSKNGYLGKTPVLSFASCEGAVREAFLSNPEVPKLTSLLRGNGWVPLVESSFEQVLAAGAVLEEVAHYFLSKSISEIKPLASHFSSEFPILEESPLRRADSKPQNQVDFHSVVLEAGGDLMAARDALLAEEGGSLVANMLGTHETPNTDTNTKSDSGNEFHSVVLDLNDDLHKMREKLAEEFDDD